MSFTRRAAHSTSTGQTQEHHCSCTQHQYALEHYPVYSMEWTIEAEDQGKVEQSLIRRRRQVTRSWPRRRRQAGVKPGGEGQSRSKPQLNSKQQKLYTAPLLHNYRQEVETLQAHHCKCLFSAWAAIWLALSLAKICFAKFITGNLE
jgi:hypothetical protein